MALISIENLGKSYGMKTLFRGMQLYIEDQDRIGIVGINGTGKSTLLKILAGLESADEGTVTTSKRTRIEYLPQSPDFDPDSTVMEQVFRGDSALFTTIRAYEAAVESAERHPSDQEHLVHLQRMTDRMTAENAWEVESQVKTILTKLSIHDFDKKVGELSGGQRKRIALAGALISPCDLLILDEPTNHMDSEAIAWLEQYLSARKGSLLMVTHDRYFLDRVCSKIFEISKGASYLYDGNYTTYVTAKAERMQLAGSLERKRQNLFRQELAWIRTGARARSTKQKARIQRFEELKATSYGEDEQMVSIPAGFTRLGKKTVILDGVSKSYGDLTLFSDISYTFLPTDRIGIVGLNGAGKSTLLNLIAGSLQPDSGMVERGDTVKIGYYTQEAPEMNQNLKAIDYIKETAEIIKDESGGYITASQMMERFLFPGELQHAPIHSMSGGERRRLYLLKILMEAPNVLLLDEPTNDLDIDTLKALEDYIDSYKGIVVAVSHDRYFLDRICNVILAIEKGHAAIHTGNYEDYMAGRVEVPATSTVSASPAAPSASSATRGGNRSEKLSYREQQDLDSLGDEIETMMLRLDAIEAEMTEKAADFTALQDLTEEQEAIEMALLEKMERLEALQEKAARIKG